MKVIRAGVFETNSSSTHSVIVARKKIMRELKSLRKNMSRQQQHSNQKLRMYLPEQR